jgi:hypothetical protein
LLLHGNRDDRMLLLLALATLTLEGLLATDAREGLAEIG